MIGRGFAGSAENHGRVHGRESGVDTCHQVLVVSSTDLRVSDPRHVCLRTGDIKSRSRAGVRCNDANRFVAIGPTAGELNEGASC